MPVERISAIFPEIDGARLRTDLSSKKRFVWIRREVTPAEAQQVHRLGLPGIRIVPEKQARLSQRHIAAHVLGVANIDNVGIAGMEKWIDTPRTGRSQGCGFQFSRQRA